jgi:hypothetical protein
MRNKLLPKDRGPWWCHACLNHSNKYTCPKCGCRWLVPLSETIQAYKGSMSMDHVDFEFKVKLAILLDKMLSSNKVK